MAKSQEKSTTVESESQFETAGEVFSDGTLLELVRSGEHGGALALLTWDGTDGTIRTRAEHKGRIYVPPSCDPSLLHVLPLPTHCGSFDSSAKLFAEIKELFEQYGDLPEEAASLVASFALSTWMVDWLPVASTLVLIDPCSGQASQLLRLLSSVCRRALMLVELTASGVRSLPTWLRPTLLIDRQALSPFAQKLLRAGSRRGVYILRSGRLVDLYGAKVISSRQHLGSAVADAAIEITLAPSRRDLPVLDDQVQQQIADKFQPRLLGYRLKNYTKVRSSEFDAPQFTAPLRELVRSLCTGLVDAPELQSRIAALLQERDEEMRADRAAAPESIVIEAALAFCHEENTTSALVGDVAQAANAIFAGRGETIELKPRAAGEHLKSLGLRTRRLGKAGRGLLLDHKMRSNIHRLAYAYEVRSVEEGLQLCPDCLGKVPVGRVGEGARGACGARSKQKKGGG